MAQRGCDETRMRSPNSPGTQAAARSRRAAQKPSRRARRAPRCGRRTFKKNAHSPVPVCRRFEPALPRPQAALNKSGEPAAAGAVLLFLLFIPIYYMAALRARVLRKSEAGRQARTRTRGAAHMRRLPGRHRRRKRGLRLREASPLPRGAGRKNPANAREGRGSGKEWGSWRSLGRRGGPEPVWRRRRMAVWPPAGVPLPRRKAAGAVLLFPGGSAIIVNCKIREKSPAAPFGGALSERKEFLCPPIKS